jgi:hypothetical protein
MDTRVSHSAAELAQYGMLSCTGDEARAFLHAQLTNDVAGLGADAARRAGWCSAKGRLLATFLVLPQENGFLLQLSQDLVAPVAKRLAMFILRTKAKLADVSGAWTQFGIWGAAAEERLAALGLHAPAAELGISYATESVVVRVGAQRFLLAVAAARRAQALAALGDAGSGAWALEEIRAGLPMVVQATQDLFVPQMVNLERLGAVDFKKGCYPGQEVVARTQYRGVLKRRMIRARVTALATPAADVFAGDSPGQPSGTVVNAAPVPEGGSELLAVVQISSLGSGSALRLGAPDGPRLELLSLPYEA